MNETIPSADALAAPAPDASPAAPKPAAADLTRVRVQYRREEALRYIGHLDMQLVWERTLRRAKVALAYSQGFNPRPRLHMACALPLGFLSECELLDVWFETPEPSTADASAFCLALGAQIQAAAPPGLQITQVTIAPLGQPALQTRVQFAEYQAYPLDPLGSEELQTSIQSLLANPSLPRERRGKPYDLRPLIDSLILQETPHGPTLWMRLSAREGATGRPEEVLTALGFDPYAFRVVRQKLVLAS